MFPSYPNIPGRLWLEDGVHKLAQALHWWIDGAPGRQKRKEYQRLYEHGKFEEAALALRQALRVAPNDPELMMRVAGLSRFGLLPLEDALPLLGRIVSEAPPILARRALIYIVNLLWERKGADAAMEWFPRLVLEGETSARILLRAAAVANDAGNHREAFNLLARVHRGKPSELSSMGYLNLILAAAADGVVELPQAERARVVDTHLSRFEGRFVELIRQSVGNVAVVANGPSLEGLGLGDSIDSHRRVVRFNNHAAAPNSSDHGQRTDIWVRAAELTHVPLQQTSPDGLIVLTGCNIRNRYYTGLQLLEPYLDKNLPVEFVPTTLYHMLFATLDASPSAGLIGLAWTALVSEGQLSPHQVMGYSLGQNTSAISYYHGSSHVGVWPSRHNWQAEQAYFDALLVQAAK